MKKQKEQKEQEKQEEYEIQKTCNIGGILYEISTESHFPDNQARHWGFHYGTRSKIILLNKNDRGLISNSRLLYNFLHELIHAIDYVFCEKVFTEELVVKMTAILYGLFSYNDFFIGDHKFPKLIRINGVKYNVLTNYEFNDWAAEYPSMSLEVFTSQLKITETDFSADIWKIELFEVMLENISGDYLTEEEEESFSLRNFCVGLVQVLKETEIDKLIRKENKGTK